MRQQSLHMVLMYLLCCGIVISGKVGPR